MPDTTTTSSASTTTDSLGWRASLPAEIQSNESLAKFPDVGAFAQDYIARTAELNDTKSKLALSVPKLPENATDADRNLYFNALGRPEQPTDYEFDSEDKNAPEWTNQWKNEFHKLGLTKDQAKNLSSAFNAQMTQMVTAHNEKLKTEMAEAETKLKSEWGANFDKNLELAKRMWTKHGEGEFDKAFDGSTGPQRFGIIKALVKFASLTGEDQSPQSQQRPSSAATTNPYPKSNMPPARSTSFPPIQ